MVRFLDGAALVSIPGGIDLNATFGCGQAFRWRPQPDGAWQGVAGVYRATIARTAEGIRIDPCDEAAFEGFWRRYLDLDCDYSACEAALACDEVLAPMVRRCGGLRLLNQPVWECLVSFLISSNNNVKRIEGIVERLCMRYGQDMGGYHAFPAPQAILAAGEDALRACGLGYRAAFVWRTAQRVCEGFPLDPLPEMGFEQAKQLLLTLHGVGEKVADCVLLFSCGYREAFPVDVWVHRAVTAAFTDTGSSPKELRAFARRRFGALAGLAQQVLFHYERICKKEMDTGRSL